MIRRAALLIVLGLVVVTGTSGFFHLPAVLAVEAEESALAAPTVDNARTFKLEFTHAIENTSSSIVHRQDLYVLVPQSNVSETVQSIGFAPEPTEFLTDEWGQTVAHYVIDTMPGKSRLEFGWTARVTMADLSFDVDPADPLDLADIPADILASYTEDDTKYSLTSPVVQQAAAEAVANAANLYEQVRDTYQYVIDHLKYSREGSWDDAATVLARGDGSCSEYDFVLIALYRANGIPARYVGGSRLRADDDYVDTVFHRAVEVYLPGYGWVPLDPTLGDTQNDAEGFLFKRYGGHFIMATAGGRSDLVRWNYHSYLKVARSSEADQVNSTRSLHWLGVQDEDVISLGLSSDGVVYVEGTDEVAVLTATVVDELGEAVSGLDSRSFASALDGSEASLLFNETSVPGTYTGVLDLTSLVPGRHEVAVTVTEGATGASDSAAVAFDIQPATEPGTAVAALTVTMSTAVRTSGKNTFTGAVAEIVVVDAGGQPIAGATVSGQWSGLTRDSDAVLTNSKGVAVMQSDQIKKASGTFALTLVSVVADGGAFEVQGDTVTSLTV